MALAAGAKAKGSDFQNLETRTHNPADGGTTTSASYVMALTGGTNPTGVAFVAPPSGKVNIFYHCSLRNDGSAGLCLVTIRVGTGATLDGGTDVVPESDTNAIQHTGTNDFAGGTYLPLEGLTPGNDYNVVFYHRRAGGSGTTLTVGRRRITVDPCIA